MNKIFNLLNSFLSPIVSFSIAAFTPLAIIGGAIANPEGAVNTFLCRMIDLLHAAWVFQTPESLKIANLLSSIGNSIPVLGKAVVYDLFQTVAAMFLIVVAIKLYKLLPFKFS